MDASDPDHENRGGAQARVLLKGRNEAIVLPGPAYLAWRRDYQLPQHTALGGNPPTQAERVEGITFVWSIGRTEPLIQAYSLTEDSSVMCERCGLRLATAVFRNNEVDPPVKMLLCRDCLDAEHGRKLVSVINEAAETPPFPSDMTDAQLRDFFRNFRLEPPGER
jgi:hypothetical protein